MDFHVVIFEEKMVLRSFACERLANSRDPGDRPRKTVLGICCAMCRNAGDNKKQLKKMCAMTWKLDRLRAVELKHSGLAPQLARHRNDLNTRSYVTKPHYVVTTLEEIETFMDKAYESSIWEVQQIFQCIPLKDNVLNVLCDARVSCIVARFPSQEACIVLYIIVLFRFVSYRVGLYCAVSYYNVLYCVVSVVGLGWFR